MRYEIFAYESDKHRCVIRERKFVFVVDPQIEIEESEFHDYEKNTHVKEKVSSKSAILQQLRRWLFKKDVSPVAVGTWKMEPRVMDKADVEALQRQFLLEEL